MNKRATLYEGNEYPENNNDTIPDGYEIRMAYWAHGHGDWWDKGEYLNVTNPNDASEDFDSDGLTNLQEYQRDPSGDFDHNGTPDIYDTDDDNDSIPTSVEVQNHLDPFNPADANGDLDHDGLSNIFEYQHGLNMIDPDTDHNGLKDGAEYHYWHDVRNLDTSTAASYCRNPNVDGDNVPDGKELNGYSVKIITGWKSDGTPISRDVWVSNADPLYAYKDRNGNWMDVDGDGVPDVIESWFSNSSIATSSDYQNRFKSKFGDDLFNQYSWVISYFKTVKRNQNESAAEKWLQNQFNPLIVEHTPPQVLKFNVKFYYYLLTAYVEYHVIVVDAGKISKVVFKNLDNGDVKVFTPNSGYLEFSGSFYATPWGANLGFKLKLFAKDIAGNRMTVEKEIKGPVGQLIDALAKIWNAIWNVLVEVGKAIAKAASIFISILEWLVKELFDRFTDFIAKVYEPLLQGIAGVVSEFVGSGSGKYAELYNFKAGGYEKYTKLALKILALAAWGEVAYRVLGIDTLMVSLESAYQYLTAGIGSLISKIVKKVLDMTTKDFIVAVLKGFAGLGMVGGLIGALLGGKGMGEILSKIGELLHLPENTISEMESFGSTIGVVVVGTFNRGSPLWYYIALVAATFGLTISALKLLFPPMSSESKFWVDVVLLSVGAAGFISWLRIQHEPGQIWRKFVAEITTKVEFFLAVGGLAALSINLYNDYQEAYGGS